MLLAAANGFRSGARGSPAVRTSLVNGRAAGAAGSPVGDSPGVSQQSCISFCCVGALLNCRRAPKPDLAGLKPHFSDAFYRDKISSIRHFYMPWQSSGQQARAVAHVPASAALRCSCSSTSTLPGRSPPPSHTACAAPTAMDTPCGLQNGQLLLASVAYTHIPSRWLESVRSAARPAGRAAARQRPNGRPPARAAASPRAAPDAICASAPGRPPSHARGSKIRARAPARMRAAPRARPAGGRAVRWAAARRPRAQGLAGSCRKLRGAAYSSCSGDSITALRV